MLAREAVNLMQQRLGGHLNRTALLVEIRTAQNEILCLPEVEISKTQGNVYLPTTDGVVVYQIAAPVRLVTRVFIRGQLPVGYGEYNRGYNALDTRWVKIASSQSNETDFTFSCPEALSPTSGTTLRFPEEFNPGNTTNVYQLEQYEWPVQPVSESVELALPDHWVTTLLYYAVKKRLEESQYGVDIYNTPQFKEMLQKYMAKQAGAASTVQNIRKARF